MRAVSVFGVLGSSHFADAGLRPSIKPSSAAGLGDTKFNQNFKNSGVLTDAGRNRSLLSGKVMFPVLEATPFLGVQGPVVGPVRLHGAPAYGHRSIDSLGQKQDVVCEKTPDGGAVCSDGTYQAPGCGDPQKIAGAAPSGSVENPQGGSSILVPAVAGAGILALAAYFFLR